MVSSPNSIDAFKSRLSYGVARPHSYRVLVSSPDRGVVTSIGLMAESASLPGKGLQTKTLTTYGPEIKVPYQEVYTDFEIGFICQSDMYERKFFDEWQRRIVNPISGYFKYQDDYTQYLTIQQLDPKGRVVYSGVAVGAFPRLIGDLRLGYNMVNQYHTLSVTFCCRRFMDDRVWFGSNGDSGIQGIPGTSQGNPTTDPLSPSPGRVIPD